MLPVLGLITILVYKSGKRVKIMIADGICFKLQGKVSSGIKQLNTIYGLHPQQNSLMFLKSFGA